MMSLEEPLYYLKIFQLFIDWVEARYQDILLPNEADFLTKFSKLSESEQAVLVRLIMRKGDFFRRSKIQYQEIENRDKALAGLVDSGLLIQDPELSVEQLGALLVKTELAQLFEFSASTKKQDMLSCLLSSTLEKKTWSSWTQDANEFLYELKCRPVIRVFQLMFFGNLHQNLTEFITSHLGVIRYESVAFSDSDKAFVCRKDIDDYLAINQCLDLIDQDRWHDALCLLTTIVSDNIIIARKVDNLNYRLGYKFERSEQFDLARKCYKKCDTVDSRIREIRILMAVKDDHGAWDRWQKIYTETDDVGVHQTLRRIARRLAPRVGEIQPENQQSIYKMNLVLAKPVDPLPIELIAREYLETPEKPVYYVENALMTALLGLWCWDALFAPVKGAFFNAFQTGPSDLTQADFLLKRSKQFESLWIMFDNDSYIDQIRQCYQQKFGIQNPLVNWSVISEDLLDTALSCISAHHLKAIFAYMLTNIKDRRGGFPDLIQFNTRLNDFEVIEVKGPGDRLQQNQSLWFDFFRRQKINSKLCIISWSE